MASVAGVGLSSSTSRQHCLPSESAELPPDPRIAAHLADTQGTPVTSKTGSKSLPVTLSAQGVVGGVL